VKPINRMLRRCVPCIRTISSISVVRNSCRSDKRSANDARWVKRVRERSEEINESGKAVLPVSGDKLQATRSMARCLSAVSEARGKSQVKSYTEGQMGIRLIRYRSSQETLAKTDTTRIATRDCAYVCANKSAREMVRIANMKQTDNSTIDRSMTSRNTVLTGSLMVSARLSMSGAYSVTERTSTWDTPQQPMTWSPRSFGRC